MIAHIRKKRELEVSFTRYEILPPSGCGRQTTLGMSSLGSLFIHCFQAEAVAEAAANISTLFTLGNTSLLSHCNHMYPSTNFCHSQHG
jgi:hypothetical protein